MLGQGHALDDLEVADAVLVRLVSEDDEEGQVRHLGHGVDHPGRASHLWHLAHAMQEILVEPGAQGYGLTRPLHGLDKDVGVRSAGHLHVAGHDAAREGDESHDGGNAHPDTQQGKGGAHLSPPEVPKNH